MPAHPTTAPHLPCPNPSGTTPHVVRNGTIKGRQRYHCRSCGAWFGATHETPLYHLHTPPAEIARALVMVMRRGSLRGRGAERPHVRNDQPLATPGRCPRRGGERGTDARPGSLDGRGGRVLVLRQKKERHRAPTDPPEVGDRWACLIQERDSRFVVAHATGRRDEDLAERVVRRAQERTGGRPLSWCSDGWRPYPRVIYPTYRRPVPTDRRGRPPLRVPAGVRLTPTVKHHDARGRLLGIETRATIGPAVARPGTSHAERLNGTLRDRVHCLTRKTHAFAKDARTWDAAVGLALFEHNWLRPHPALRQPCPVGVRHYARRAPAMALRPADHPWSWIEFLTMPVPITS